jgi:hypothetical protein
LKKKICPGQHYGLKFKLNDALKAIDVEFGKDDHNSIFRTENEKEMKLFDVITDP